MVANGKKWFKICDTFKKFLLYTIVVFLEMKLKDYLQISFPISNKCEGINKFTSPKKKDFFRWNSS